MAPTKRIFQTLDLAAAGFVQKSNLIKRTRSDLGRAPGLGHVSFYATIGAANAGAATNATAPRNRGCSSAGTT